MKKCRIVWKDGGRRLFDIFDENEIDKMKCSEAINYIISYSDLEHELLRHKEDISYIECNGEKMDLERVMMDASRSLDRVADKALICMMKKLD